MPKTRDLKRQTQSAGVSIEIRVLAEADSLRGDIPRSRYVERALIMLNQYVKRNGKIALVKDASSVGAPEHLMTVDSPTFVEVNSLQQTPRAVVVTSTKESAIPVNG